MRDAAHYKRPDIANTWVIDSGEKRNDVGMNLLKAFGPLCCYVPAG